MEVKHTEFTRTILETIVEYNLQMRRYTNALDFTNGERLPLK